MNSNKSMQKGRETTPRNETAPPGNRETTSRSNEVDREEIARRAYELWEANGRPSGHDMEYWLQAEAGISQGKPNRSTANAELSGARGQR